MISVVARPSQFPLGLNSKVEGKDTVCIAPDSNRVDFSVFLHEDVL